MPSRRRRKVKKRSQRKQLSWPPQGRRGNMSIIIMFFFISNLGLNTISELQFLVVSIQFYIFWQVHWMAGYSIA